MTCGAKSWKCRGFRSCCSDLLHQDYTIEVCHQYQWKYLPLPELWHHPHKCPTDKFLASSKSCNQECLQSRDLSEFINKYLSSCASPSIHFCLYHLPYFKNCIMSFSTTCRNNERIIVFGNFKSWPIFQVKSLKCPFGRHVSQIEIRFENPLIILDTIRWCDSTEKRSIFSGHSNQNRNSLKFSPHKSFCIVNRIDPKAKLLNRDIFIQLAFLRIVVKSDLFKIQVDLSLIVHRLLTNNP